MTEQPLVASQILTSDSPVGDRIGVTTANSIATHPANPIARIVAAALQMPIAAIGFIEGNRFWIESSYSEMALNLDGIEALYREALTRNDSWVELEIPQDWECVTPETLDRLPIRFLLGYPLKDSKGNRVGMLYGMDTQPRQLNDRQMQIVRDLAAWVETERQTARQQARVQAHLEAKIDRLEGELEQLQRDRLDSIQREKMASLGRLVGGVAHEINNPVSFIYGNLAYASQYGADLLHLVELYQQYYDDPAAEIVDFTAQMDLEFLKTDFFKLTRSMERGAQRIRNIVRSLQIFARPDDSELQWVNLHEELESLLYLLENRFKLEACDRPVRVMKDYGEFSTISCYPKQLDRALLNLLENAIDALELRVREVPEITPTIWITTECQGDRAVIRIANNGVRMSPEIQQRAFDPFFTTKPVGCGIGLGLSIAYQIVVERHGGQLRCTSPPDVGTEFAIEIPLDRSNRRDRSC